MSAPTRTTQLDCDDSRSSSRPTITDDLIPRSEGYRRSPGCRQREWERQLDRLDGVADADPARNLDCAVHPEEELRAALAVARKDVERREVLLRRVRVQCRDDAPGHRVSDRDDRVADPDALS